MNFGNLLVNRTYIALKSMAFVTVYLHACTIFISVTFSENNYSYREEHVSCTCEAITARYRHMWAAV